MFLPQINKHTYHYLGKEIGSFENTIQSSLESARQ